MLLDELGAWLFFIRLGASGGEGRLLLVLLLLALLILLLLRKLEVLGEIRLEDF